MKIGTKGQVTIPQEIRERLGLLPHTEVRFTVEGSSVVLRKVEGTRRRGRSLVEHLRGRATTAMSTEEILALTRRRVSAILIDSNVLLDVLTEDPVWYEWSAEALESRAEEAVLVINPIVYPEISVGFQRIEELEEALPVSIFRRDDLPWEAGFLAGKCFLRYRRHGGERRSPLPDFYIGAHAAVRGLRLLTRDAARYRTYFPRLEIIAP